MAVVEPAPVETAPVETAPVETAPVEAEMVEPEMVQPAPLTNSVEPDPPPAFGRGCPHHRPSPEQRAHADELIHTLGMARRADAPWTTLSQGERGRTLMPQPRLLLLDEPATGLDLTAREQLLSSLDELRQRHPALASVLVTHHLEELPATTSHALLLRDGRCVASGPAAEVVTTDLISACFDHPVRITREDGRWAARADRTALSTARA